MLNKLAICSMLAGLMFALPACNQAKVTYTDDGPDRIIRTEVVRDTKAARQANERGVVLLEEAEYAEAAAQFRKAIEEDSHYGAAHNNLGRAYFLQSKHDSKNLWYEAAHSFGRARDLMPRNPEPYNNLGLVYEEDGKLDRAVDFYRQAVDAAPRDTRFIGNLARALVRRGDRTDEVAELLDYLLANDKRPEWLVWAQQVRGTMHVN